MLLGEMGLGIQVPPHRFESRTRPIRCVLLLFGHGTAFQAMAQFTSLCNDGVGLLAMSVFYVSLSVGPAGETE
jgi:hypothetical protein